MALGETIGALCHFERPSDSLLSDYKEYKLLG